MSVVSRSRRRSLALVDSDAADSRSARQQGVIDRVKEVDPLDGLLLDGARLGEPVEGTDTGREVIERDEVRQIAAIAAKQDLAQVDQAVDGLLDGGEGPRRRPFAMFHLAVVLEEGDVVRRLDAQHTAELVVHLDRGTAKA